MRYAAAVIIIMLTLLTCRTALGDSYVGLIKRGNRYYKKELYKEAGDHYLKGGLKNKRSPVPRFNTAAAAYKRGEYAASIESLNEALTRVKKGGASDIYYNLGNSYFMLGDYRKAADHYISGLDLNPDDLDMKYNLELALKKLKGGQKDGDEERDGGKKEEQSGEEGEQRKENGDKSGAERGEKNEDFTREEAEQLLGSINPDSSVMNQIIRQRTGTAENDRDW